MTERRSLLARARSWLTSPATAAIDALNTHTTTAFATTTDRLRALEAAFERTAVRLENVERVLAAQPDVREASLYAAGLTARAARLAAERAAVGSQAAPREMPIDFDTAKQRLRDLKPALFPIWWQLFEAGARSYDEERLGSCSHRDHAFARLFGAYVDIHAHGRILDVGCGPHDVPSYLSGRRLDSIFGVEPLPLRVTPPYRVLRGFGECLPWADGQFDAVVSGTSLDHVLSLKHSLLEVARVLKPNGTFVVWLASIPGAVPFDDDAAVVEPIDRFHLFHFERTWIEPIFESVFQIADVTVVPQIGFDHVFYCLVPRARSLQTSE